MRARRMVAAAASFVAVVAATAMTPVAQAVPPISYSPSELSAVKQTLDSRLSNAPDGVTSWYVDPATNRVKVSVLAGDAAALAAARAKTSGLAGVSIQFVSQRPRPYYNLVGGQAIYSSGGRCSIGFSARNTAGVAYVLTAGHCTKVGVSWSGYNQVPIGTGEASNFPTDDFARIRVTSSSWTATNQVMASGSIVRITGSSEAAIGASVCRSGSTTGYRCGTIQAKNATVNYGRGNIVYGLTQTTVCAEPGDSGGSWISGTQAQGLTSGGSGNCTSGGTTYFQPINEVLNRYSLRLVTS